MAAIGLGQQSGSDIEDLRSYFNRAREQVISQHSYSDTESRLKQILEYWDVTLATGSSPECQQGIDFTYRKARELADSALSTGDDGAHHQCRKWVKYYLFQLQMLLPEKITKKKGTKKQGTKNKKYLKKLTRLGHRLGVLHDRCVLEQTLNDLLSSVKSETDTQTNPDLERSISLTLNWLAEQKQQDKAYCHTLFNKVFKQSENPVTL